MSEDDAVNLHPLVVMSIADHYTREKIQFKRDRVFGAIFGTQTGREVNILECFGIAYAEDKKETLGMQLEGFEADMKLFEEVYPNYECLGWYTTGEVDDECMQRHSLFTKYNERPLFVVMNPKEAKDDTREMPIKVFFEETQLREGVTTNEFVPTPYEIKADEAERVTAVYCAKVVTGDDSVSAVVPQYSNLDKASTALKSRVHMISQYLKDTNDGKIPRNHKVLRGIKALCNRLPVTDSDEFKQEYLNEYNDALLVAYLSTITKGTGIANGVVSKFKKASPGAGGVIGGGRHGARMNRMMPAGMGMGMSMGY